MPDTTPDVATRRARIAVLMLTVAVIVFFAISGRSDRSGELRVSGEDTSTVSQPTATVVVAGVSVSTNSPASPSATAASDPLTFRKPLNGIVSVTLKWDCYDCVDWPTLHNMHHPATDYLSSDPTIVATADGLVVKMNTGCGGQGCGNSYGNWVFLKHTLTDGSTLYSFYAHMSEIAPAVSIGACIKTGQKVGVIGNTGLASAAHLHFGIQTNTNLLEYTSASSATVGSIDPETLYGKTTVKNC
jgi:murein DD-endopeptidase MepM/ murein hydrolase activator NlpD